MGELGWRDAAGGYQVALAGERLIARNPRGRVLASVPAVVAASAAAAELIALREWLAEHARACVAAVETWMLRSLPVPRAVLEQVWDDPAWRAPLANAVVVTGDGGGGLFRGVDPARGVGVVDLDGETSWLAAEQVAIPHPILLPELDAWRELIIELGVGQGVPQLLRETHARPASLAGNIVEQFEGGAFPTLFAAISAARALGYPVRGGFATCQVWEAGAVCEARYWIGADVPDAATTTGQLLWVDERARGMPLAAVGPVAFSEGMRMAAAIYAARTVAVP